MPNRPFGWLPPIQETSARQSRIHQPLCSLAEFPHALSVRGLFDFEGGYSTDWTAGWVGDLAADFVRWLEAKSAAAANCRGD